ncbi:MAG: hypothetical protein GY760_02180 [Deltaproteobacteria bacterium]|nr:hypothetical protein [Deltaproteobacteria bacterium]
METMISFGQLATVLKGYGPYGLILVLWYIDMRQIRKMAHQYQTDMKDVLSEHKEYMSEIRRMYENNVILVEIQQQFSKDLKDIIMMNTRAMTHLSDDIEQNRYCPELQIRKENIKVGR